MMERAFRDLIKTASGLSAVNWMGSPDDVYPSVDLWMVSQPGEHTHDGPVAEKTATVQVDVYSKDLAESITIRNAVEVLNGFSSDGVIRSILRITTRGMNDTDKPGEVLYRWSIDFKVRFI